MNWYVTPAVNPVARYEEPTTFEARTVKLPPDCAILILWSIMPAPPINSALLQLRPKVDFVLKDVSSARLTGESGLVVITAPLPSMEIIELP